MPSIIYKFEEQEHRFPLKDRTTIGRVGDNDLCVPSDSISSHHAVITRDKSGYFRIEDTGSRNGVIVNGQRFPIFPLEDGTRFELGDVEFLFSAADGQATAHEIQPEAIPPVKPEAVPAAKSVVVPLAEPGTVPIAKSDAVPLAEPDVVSLAKPELAVIADQPEVVIARFKEARERVLDQIGKVIIGQRDVINQMLVALFARGHCLLVGVPGLAKTLMVRTLGNAVALDTRRIQFTPDLMPSDITGTDILEEDSSTGKRAFRFHRGPIFTNLLLADEINRTPPKTQAALLEAMQEHRVTISGTSYDLPDPFMVLATQNPIEQEGTYPLPEAQLDRFMFCVHLAYPSAQEEQQVILDTTGGAASAVTSVLNAAEVLELQQFVRQVPVSEHVALYAMNIVRGTRPNAAGAPDFVNRWIRWGAGTRAGQYLLLAAKAHVLLQGRFSVSCADVREYALPVLRHRIFPNFSAASEGVNTDQIVKKILDAVKEPNYQK
jgi:MoxR-like ATPase